MTDLDRRKLRLKTVLARISNEINEAKSDEDDEILQWETSLSIMLNQMLESDCFGTEGQNDPRGDQRDMGWSMHHVEGID